MLSGAEWPKLFSYLKLNSKSFLRAWWRNNDSKDDMKIKVGHQCEHILWILATLANLWSLFDKYLDLVWAFYKISYQFWPILCCWANANFCRWPKEINGLTSWYINIYECTQNLFVQLVGKRNHLVVVGRKSHGTSGHRR